MLTAENFDTDDVDKFPNFLLNLWNFVSYFWDFNGSSTICKCSYWNLRKKRWKISAMVISFSNDESACPPTPLKTVSTSDILIDQVHKFHNSCFMETLKALILTIISLNIHSKVLSFYGTITFTGLSKQFVVPFIDSSSRPEVFVKFLENQQENTWVGFSF